MFDRFPLAAEEAALEEIGFHLGPLGPHTSRTIMFADLRELLRTVAADVSRTDYAAAIIEENVLGKKTFANRRESLRRLRELYSLNRRVALFRVFLRLWRAGSAGRPLLALLAALARDPLLRATAAPVVRLEPGARFQRSILIGPLREAAAGRLNEAMIDKVARYTASSWTQAGLLEGRVRKVRRRPDPSPETTAFALWLAASEGYPVRQLLESPWCRLGDASRPELLQLTLQANQLGYVHARAAADLLMIDTTLADPALSR